MRTYPSLLMALSLSAASFAASAQAVPTPSAVAASTPPAASAGPRRASPTELRESATMPGDLRPADAVTPQIVIPLRPGASPARLPFGARPAAPAASAGIDDTAARCEAASSRASRERCLRGRAKTPPLR